jgi:hypothetical protein
VEHIVTLTCFPDICIDRVMHYASEQESKLSDSPTDLESDDGKLQVKDNKGKGK